MQSFPVGHFWGDNFLRHGEFFFGGGKFLGSGSFGVYGCEKMSQGKIGTKQTLFTFPPTIMEVENESFGY